MASQVNIQGLITSLLTGSQKVGPIVIANTINIGSVTAVPMTATTATVTLPTGAEGATPIACLITPPANNGASITMKTSSNPSDAGLPIGPATASLFSFAATPPTSLTFTFGATGASLMEVMVW